MDKRTTESKDEAIEQVAIAVDVTGYHCSLADSPLLPRTEMIESLLKILSDYPSLAKVAKVCLGSSSLVLRSIIPILNRFKISGFVDLSCHDLPSYE